MGNVSVDFCSKPEQYDWRELQLFRCLGVGPAIYKPFARSRARNSPTVSSSVHGEQGNGLLLHSRTSKHSGNLCGKVVSLLSEQSIYVNSSGIVAGKAVI